MNASLSCYIDSIGIAASGFVDWPTTQRIFRGESQYDAALAPVIQPTLMPANERRRAPPAVKIAFAAAEEAMKQASSAASEFASVFASSDADMIVLHRICSALTLPTRIVSPTDFHNSVHNAAAGYFSIGAASHLASTTIAAYDYSFAMGLMEAINLTTQDSLNTLLVTYDVPPPAPLYEHRPIAAAMAIAIALTPNRRATSLARMEVIPMQGEAIQDAITPIAAEFATLVQTAPPARALPLLSAVANREHAEVVLECPANGRLRLNLRF